MKILMLETRKGTEDGFTVHQYYKGHIYEVNSHLGKHFWREGFAKPIGEESV